MTTLIASDWSPLTEGRATVMTSSDGPITGRLLGGGRRGRKGGGERRGGGVMGGGGCTAKGKGRAGL